MPFNVSFSLSFTLLHPLVSWSCSLLSPHCHLQPFFAFHSRAYFLCSFCLYLSPKLWQMQFNVTNCHTMRISRRKEPASMGYYIDHRKLSPVINHRYLGVMLSNDLKWNSHVNNIVAKASRSLSFVKGNLYSCTETTKRSVYVTIVRPP